MGAEFRAWLTSEHSTLLYGGKKADLREKVKLKRAPLLGVGIGAEHLHVAAMLLQQGDGFGDLAVNGVAIAVHEEEVFPHLAFAGARLDFRHVQPITAKRGERGVERANLVLDAEHEAGAV